MKRSDYLLKNKINSAETTVRNAEKRSDRLLKTPVKPPKPKPVTMRGADGKKYEVPKAYATALMQTVRENKQPFVLMENNLRAQKAAEDAYNKSIRDAMEFGGRLAPDEHETNMAELRELDAREKIEVEKWKLGEKVDYVGFTPLEELPEANKNALLEYQKTRRPAQTIIEEKKRAIESRADEDALSKYLALRYNPDFAEMSAYKSTKHGEAVIDNSLGNALGEWNAPKYSDTGYDDLYYEVINKNPEAIKIWKQQNDYGEDPSARDYINQEEKQELTAEEVAIYNYLRTKDKQNGTHEASKFLSLIQEGLNARYTDRIQREAYQSGKEHPVEASLYRLLTAPKRIAPSISMALDYAFTGEVDANSPKYKDIRTSRAMTAGVSDLIEENAGGFWAGTYNIGMSAAENAYVGFLSGGSSTIASTIMATTAFGETVTEAKDRGLSSDQAISLGFVTAGAELITEKIGFDKVFDASKKGGAKALAGAMVSNGLEEMSSGTITTIADVMIAKDKSEWQEKINKYKAQGFSEEEAFGKAFLEVAGEIGFEGIAGMVSAGAMVGTSYTTNAAMNAYERASEGRALGKEFRESNMTAEDMQTIISEGLATDPDSSSYKLAAKLQQKLDAGQPVSWGEFGKLYNENLTNVDSGFETEESAAKPTVTVDSDDEKRNTTPGFVRNEYSYDVSNKTIRALDAIGKKLGVEIEIGAPTGNSVDAYNGKYENGKITIARDAENPLEVVLSHEVTHRMKETAPAEYAKFVEMAVNATENLSDVEKAELIKDYNEMYGFKGKDSDTKAIDEITADYAGKLVRDVSLFRNLVKADRNVAQRFIDGIRDFIAKVKSTFSKDKSKADTASLEKYGLKVSEIEEAVKTWEQMVKATETAVKSGEAAINDEARTTLAKMSVDDIIDEAKTYDVEDGVELDESLEEILAEQKNTAETEPGGERKYSINRSVYNELDEWLSMSSKDREKSSGRFLFGTTSKALRSIGAPDYKIYWDKSSLAKKMKTHKELTPRVIKNLPSMIENPVMILQSESVQGSITIWGIKDDGKHPVMVSIKLDPKTRTGEIRDYAVITSAYSRPVSQLQSFINKKENILYLDPNKKRTDNWLQSLGLQLPPLDHQYGSIREVSFSNNSIPETSGKSNPQFSLKKNTDNQGRELSSKQAEYFKDSKVRDNDGNLLVMYRGGNEDFTVFDRKKSKHSNLYGRGFYFTDSESHAKQYGNVRAYYLNIKNPVSTTEKTITKEQLRAYLEAVAKNEDDYSFENYGYGATVDGVLNSVYQGKSDFQMLYDISQTAIGDMVEAVELFNEINGTEYDGLILDTETVTFNSNQAKDVDNKTPTENPDIRYSLKGKKPIGPDAERKTERERVRELESENAKQKKLIEQLKDRMKDMSPNRKPGQVDEKAVRKAAREFVQRYSATVKASELAPKLKKLWDRMGTGRNLSWEEVSTAANEIATEIAESAVEKDDTLYQEFADLRKYMRDTTITISESDRSNITDFADFRKRNMGRMKIGHGETNVDRIFKELGVMYPGMFDEESISHPADQLMRISEVLGDVYKITESNPFKKNMDNAINSIANDILETFYEIPENKKTFQEMKIQRLERTVLERDAQIKETVKNLTEYHKSVEKMLSEWEKKQKDIEEKKMALKEERERFYEKQDERKKRAQIIRATNRLSQKLRWATDKKHIPHELQGAVARFLEYVNLTGLYTYDEKGKLQKSDDGTPTQKSLTYRQLRAIYQQYDGEFTFPPEFLEGVFEDGEQRGDILGQIYDLRETRVAEMNKEQLDVILKGVKIVETAVKNADIMFSNSRFKEISSLAENIKENAPIKNKFIENRFKSMLKQILDIDNLTPEAFFHRLGAGGDAIFSMLSEAEAKRTRIVQKVGEFTEKLLDPKKRRELEESTVKVQLGGEDIEMSVAQIMELYALSRRKQAEKHILEGGVIIEGIPGKKGEKRRRAIRASVREIGKAINNLTPEQRKLAEQLSKFASDKLGGYMNEACKKVFGYEKFGEINYWPIRIDDRTIHKKADTADAARATPTIRNFGMAKGLTHGANNALKIGSIFDTFAEHASQATTYAAYLGAMEDMRRILNFTYDNGEGMQHVLDGVFGIHEKKVNGKVEDTHPGIEYWNKLYEDINGGMKPKDGGSPFDTFLRNAKLSSIAANARVIIQQPTAYIRAASEIDPKYLVEGTIHAKRGWKRALKYAPVAQQKDWGRADIGTGQTMKEILFGLDGAIPKIQEASMWLAGKADAAAWGSLWSACEKEIKDKHKKIKPDSEAFFEAVAKRFTQIINKTQVVDGVLQRSQNMRKQNALVKLGTMFMSEPTKQYNMIASAVYDLANSKSKEKKKAAKRKIARTATVVIFSTVINAAAQSIIDAMRDEEEDEKYWEKWLSAFQENLAEGLNPIGYFPFAKDLWSIAQGYDVKRTDVEGIADFVQAVFAAGKSITGDGKQSVASGVNDLIAAGASLFGIPYASLKRDVGAFSQTIIQGIGNPVLDYNVAKLTKNIKNAKNADFFMDILYKAKAEDKDAFKIIYEDMVKNGFKKEDINKYIETYTSKKFDSALSSARKSKEAENATAEDKVLYKHLNREKNMNREERAGDEDTVLENLDKYRANVEKYLKEYPGKDEEKQIDYAYRKANYATYGAKYAIRASAGKSVYDKALEKVNRGKTTWEEYYDEYFGKDERRYEALRDRFGISYEEYEKIAEAMSKNGTEEEEIEALHKLGYRRSTARVIRRKFNKVK